MPAFGTAATAHQERRLQRWAAPRSPRSPGWEWVEKDRQARSTAGGRALGCPALRHWPLLLRRRRSLALRIGILRSSAAAAVMALPPRRMTPDHRTSISGIADPAEARSARMPRGREARGVALPRRGCHDRAVAASVGAGTTPGRRVSPADGSGRTPSGAGLQRRARHRGPTPGGVAGAAARCWSRRATRLRPLSRRRAAPGPCRRPRRHWLEHARGCTVLPGACGWAVQ